MKKLVALLTTAMLVFAVAAPVMAEKYDGTTPIQDTSQSLSNVETTTFDKYLVMDQGAKVPNADFWYTLTADAITNGEDPEEYPDVLIQATNGDPSDVTPVVWKGVKPEKVVITAQDVDYTGSGSSVQAELTFGPSDATEDGEYRENKSDIATDKEKYVKETMTFDFSDITFAEPGVYRYYLTESNADTYSDLGISYDVNAATANQNERTLDVYVLDDEAGNLYIADYVWYEGKLTTSAAPSHTADETAANGNAWAVTWTDATDTTKTYEYDSNNTWIVKVNGTANGETVAEPPASATGSVTIDSVTKTTWGEAKAYMENYTAKTLTPNGAEASTPKSSEFVNKYNTQDLEFGKKVEGNQGSRDQWFKFTLTLEHDDLEAGTEFAVNIGCYGDPYTSTSNNIADFFAPTKNSATLYDEDDMQDANALDDTDAKKAAFTDAKNTTDENIIVSEDGSLTWVLYLQHGQYVQIKGIPNGVEYTVEEEDPVGYTVTEGTDAPNGVIDGETISNKHMDPLKGTIGSKQTTTYVQDNEGLFYKNGDAYDPLYKGDDGKVYTDAAKTEEYTGAASTRYAVDENVYTGVTNKRDGVIPTGVALGIGGIAALLAIAAIYLFIRKRNAEYED